MYAGLQKAKGDYVVIMDADLQDPPALLPEMYRAVTEEGYDCVGSRRVTRKGEPPIRSFFARMFYKLINKMSDADIVDGARDFQMMSRKVVDAILSLGEYNRFSKGIFGWIIAIGSFLAMTVFGVRPSCIIVAAIIATPILEKVLQKATNERLRICLAEGEGEKSEESNHG